MCAESSRLTCFGEAMECWGGRGIGQRGRGEGKGPWGQQGGGRG